MTSDHGHERKIAFAAPEIVPDDIAAVVGVLESGWLTTGKESAALEDELARYLNVPHVLAVSSCTAALEILLASLSLSPGARVGVPTWTFAATALAAHRLGAVPVLLDINPDTLNLCPSSLAAALEDGLDAVMPVHFGGVPVERSVFDQCAMAGVPVVEDGAHSLGATSNGEPVSGKHSAGIAFSFYATKNLTCGEGGAIATKDPAVAEFCRLGRLHGMTRDAAARSDNPGPDTYDIVSPGYKANLPDLLAALARSQLRRFPANQLRRQELVARYRSRLAGAEGITFRPTHPDEGSANHLLVIELASAEDRDRIATHLRRVGIGTSVHFTPLHELSWFREHSLIGPTGTAAADAVSGRVLSLPLHPGLTEGDVDLVCDELLLVLDDSHPG